ncbi:MAG: hypothetical protein ACOCWC_05315 [Bacteroidota bacterium]
MSNNKFDIEYKKWLSQLDEPADESLWDEIENELDFVETWDNISDELDSRLSKKRATPLFLYWKYALATAAMILLIIAPVKYINEQIIQPNAHLDNYIAKLEIPADITDVVESSETDTNKNLIKKDSYSKPPADTKHDSNISEEKRNIIVQNIIEEDYTRNNNEVALSKINSLNINTDFLIADDSEVLVKHYKNKITDNNDKISTLISEESSKSFISIVDVGFAYGYKNTWLVNYETKNGLDPTKLGNTLLTFHSDIGATTRWAIKGKTALGVEFFWKSESGQKYQEYIDASFVEREISLNYMKLQTYYIYDYRNIPGKSLLGGYVAKLEVGEEKQGDLKFNVNQDYSNYDYGIFLAYEINIPIYNRITLTPGFRVNYSLINIFEGNENIPGYLKNTKSLTAGFNLTASYRIFK